MSLPLRHEKVPLVETNALNSPGMSSEYELKPSPQRQISEQYERAQQKDLAIKRRIRNLTFLSRVISVILSGFMVGSMAYALYMYQTTKDMTLSGGQHPWSPQTVLWPTFMVLSTAGVTFIMNIIILSAYMCGAMAADKTSTIMGYIGYGITAIHVVVWVINAGLFKMAFTGRDLWGFSCSTEADALQAQVKSVLNYTTLCQIQTGTWITAIIETISYLILFIGYIFVAYQFMHSRRLKKLQQRMSTEGF
ncbi:hypothetical protein MMC19_000234 [Ptychographa xylographoides]|nr:hypothetical protein [Ptychographa xylographoides]